LRITIFFLLRYLFVYIHLLIWFFGSHLGEISVNCISINYGINFKHIDEKTLSSIIVLSILSTVTFLDRIAISTAGERISKDLGLSPVQWGWVLGMFTLAYGLLKFHRIIGRPTRCQTPSYSSSIVVVIFTVLTGFSTGFVMLLAVRFLFGIGEAGAYPIFQ
jgi:MFS family permease